MRLAQIEQFIAVVDTGSIRGAARQLGISQPALSRGLQQLEEDLGVQLVQRTVRGASLTSAGSAFLARARVVHTELRKAADDARRAVDAGGGLVSLGLNPVGVLLLLPELATTLQRARPGTRMRIMETAPGAALPLVRDAILDLAVTQRTRANLAAELMFRPLFEIQLHIAVRCGHPLAGTRALRELSDASWLSMTPPGSSDDIVSQSFLAIGRPAPVPAVHCSSFSVALELIAATDMLGVLPPHLLQTSVRAGKLEEIRLEQPLVPLVVGLYTRPDTPLTPAARATSQIIVAIARRIAATGGLRTTEPIVGARADADERREPEVKNRSRYVRS